MANLDLTLNSFHVAGIGNYEQPFGTKLPDGIGMTTTQAQDDINMPFVQQRVIEVVETSTTTVIESDRRIAFKNSAINLTLGKPSAVGLKVVVSTLFDSGSSSVIFPVSSSENKTVPLAKGDVVELISVEGLYWKVHVMEKNSLVINTLMEKMCTGRYLYPSVLPTDKANSDTDFVIVGSKPKDKVYIKAGTSIPINVTDIGRLIFYTDTNLVVGSEIHDDTFTNFDAGKDYYLYLVYNPTLFPSNPNNLGLKLSLNDPEGISLYGNSDIFGSGINGIKAYPEVAGQTLNEGNCKCIGGFHTLCYTADVLGGEMTHPFTGYVAKDIHPYSVWDNYHRPIGHTAGYTYVPTIHKWASIYLLGDRGVMKTGEWGVYGGEYPNNKIILMSAYNKLYATGATAKIFQCAKGEQILALQKQRLPHDFEFTAMSLGSPQGVNIRGSSNPTKSGGHYSTDNKRILSYCGCEDTVGVLWQWGADYGYGGSGSWANNYDGNDADVKGQQYAQPNRVLFGGHWDSGAYCGSRGRYWNLGVLYCIEFCGFRGLSEPLH